MGLWSDLQGAGLGQAFQAWLTGTAPDPAGALGAGITALLHSYPLQTWAQWQSGIYLEPLALTEQDDWVGRYEVLMIAARRLLNDLADDWRTPPERVRIASDARSRLIDASATAEYAGDASRIVQAEAGIVICSFHAGDPHDVRKAIDRIKTIAEVGVLDINLDARRAYQEALNFTNSFDRPVTSVAGTSASPLRWWPVPQSEDDMKLVEIFERFQQNIDQQFREGFSSRTASRPADVNASQTQAH